jgi:hypothetical protein
MQQTDQVYEVVSEPPVGHQCLFANVTRQCLVVKRQRLHDHVGEFTGKLLQLCSALPIAIVTQIAPVNLRLSNLVAI